MEEDYTYGSLHVFSLGALLIVILFIGCQPTSTHLLNKTKQADKEGFIPIFNGESLASWQGDSTYWRVEGGNLIGEVTPATLQITGGPRPKW